MTRDVVTNMAELLVHYMTRNVGHKYVMVEKYGRTKCAVGMTRNVGHKYVMVEKYGRTKCAVGMTRNVGHKYGRTTGMPRDVSDRHNGRHKHRRLKPEPNRHN